MKTLWLTALLALAAGGSARADMVFLNGGDELSGQVVDVSSAAVVLRADGKDTAYPTAQVLKVKLVHLFGVPGEDKASAVADPALKALLASPPRPQDFPDDGYVTALDDKDCDVGADRRVTCTRRVIRVVLRERDKEKAANIRVYYLSGVQTAAIDWARAINGEKVSDLDDTSVEEGSEYSQFPAYDRLKSIKFAVPDVATGTVIDYRTRVESPVDVATEPFDAAMEFRSFEPALEARFTVTAPTDVPLAFVESGLPPGAQSTIEDLGARVRRTWVVRNVPSFKQEDDLPPASHITPYVEAAPAATWPQVAAAAAAAVSPRLDPGPDVSARAAEIVKGKRTDAAKVEALYDWVAEKIKYQPVTMDVYSYVPKSPAEVFAAKAGDALDKPFLLYVMLRQAGFQPQLAYLEDKGDLPFAESLPTLGQFEAAAVLLDLDGKRLVLTPLEDTRRWQETPEWLQGVHGLVVLGPDAGKTFENPLAPAQREGESDRLALSLSGDGSLSGSATLRPLGEEQASWRAMKDWKRQDVEHEFEQLVHDIHPQARLTGYSVTGLDDPTRDLAVHLSFRIRDYALTASGGYMAFQLPWVGASAEDVGAPSREQPMFWWRRSGETKDISVRLPKGWELYYAPPPASLSGPGVAFEASYRAAGGKLDYTAKTTREATRVAPADYAGYKTYREAVARYAERWVVVKKAGPKPVN